MNIPETAEELNEYLRAVEAGEVELPPAPNKNLVVKLLTQRSTIQNLEASKKRIHDMWIGAFDRVNETRITPDERRITNLLAVAWNEFNELQPEEDENKADFRRAINSASAIIALRIAKRADPTHWT